MVETVAKLVLNTDPESLISSSVKQNVQKVLNTGRLFRYDCKVAVVNNLLLKDYIRENSEIIFTDLLPMG